jgi:GT2 family glycosyltransferase
MGDLTISIVSHGHGDLLVFLLQDIADHVPDAEVIVTLNIPEPSLELSAWPNVTFRHNRTAKGFGANHNAALRSARTDWLAIVNPDIRLTEFCFPVLHEAMACTSGTAMLAPKVIGPPGFRTPSAYPGPCHQARYSPPQGSGNPSGCDRARNMVRRHVLGRAQRRI